MQTRLILSVFIILVYLHDYKVKDVFMTYIIGMKNKHFLIARQKKVLVGILDDSIFNIFSTKIQKRVLVDSNVFLRFTKFYIEHTACYASTPLFMKKEPYRYSALALELYTLNQSIQ